MASKRQRENEKRHIVFYTHTRFSPFGLFACYSFLFVLFGWEMLLVDLQTVEFFLNSFSISFVNKNTFHKNSRFHNIRIEQRNVKKFTNKTYYQTAAVERTDPFVQANSFLVGVFEAIHIIFFFVFWQKAAMRVYGWIRAVPSNHIFPLTTQRKRGTIKCTNIDSHCWGLFRKLDGYSNGWDGYTWQLWWNQIYSSVGMFYKHTHTFVGVFVCWFGSSICALPKPFVR